MKKEFSKSELQELERQLSCPEGDLGIQIAHTMNQSNISMTEAAIEMLDIKKNSSVLEAGHGNGAHINKLLQIATDIQYSGLEISKTMYSEARANTPSSQAQFHLYEGHIFPFADASFDYFFSVNTIYFWKDPSQIIAEIQRTLKPNGIGVLAFADKKYMQDLPFVKDRFTLYGKENLETLLLNSKLQITDYQMHEEQVQSKTGDMVHREFHLVKLSKL